MNFLTFSIISLSALSEITAADSSQIQFTDPANDDCKPTKKMGSVDLDLHFKGRIYDKEKDTTTFQYQFQRLLQESENVIFGITNCFPDDLDALYKFHNSTCFYGHTATQVESVNLYELRVRGDVGEGLIVAHKFNEKSYSIITTLGPNCWCRDHGLLCKEDYAKRESQYKCYNYPDSDNITCGAVKNSDNKNQIYFPNVGCQVAVKLSGLNNDHRCAYPSSKDLFRLGVQETDYPGVILYTCDTDFCNPKSLSHQLALSCKTFLILLSSLIFVIYS